MEEPKNVEFMVIRGRLLPFKTEHPNDDEMHKLFAGYTVKYVKRCLFCKSKKLVASALFIPEDLPQWIDALSGKRMLFGYCLCADHYEESIDNVKMCEDEIEGLYQERLEEIESGFVTIRVEDLQAEDD